MLPQAGSALTIPLGSWVLDTATGSWHERWKHWKGRGAPALKLRAGDRFAVCSLLEGKRVPAVVGGSTRRSDPVANAFNCCGQGSIMSS